MKVVFFRIIFIVFFLSGMSLSALSDDTESKTGTIFVTVKSNADGNSIRGATVKLYRWEGDKKIFAGGGMTDNNGQVLIYNLRIGAKYEVEVSALGYNTQIHVYEKLHEKEYASFSLSEETVSTMNLLEKCSYILCFLKEN